MTSLSIPGQLVRSCALQGNIRFSQHALQRMDERQILADEVRAAILNGHEIEIQQPSADKPDFRVLFQEVNGISFYVVTVCSQMTCLVLSVCITADEAWDVVKGVLRRGGR